MIDHVGIKVSNLKKSISVYKTARTPLGYKIKFEGNSYAGFGIEKSPDFRLAQSEAPSQAAHLAFLSNNRKSVELFYYAALSAGGVDNGKPGLRPHYHPNYFGAFVFDPDGNNIEAVCHKPEIEI